MYVLIYFITMFIKLIAITLRVSSFFPLILYMFMVYTIIITDYSILQQTWTKYFMTIVIPKYSKYF